MDQNQLYGLLQNPMFQAGMGLLAHRADKNVNPAQAVMAGLGNAQQQQHGAQDRERMQMVQQQMYGLLGGQQQPGAQPPAPAQTSSQPGSGAVPQPNLQAQAAPPAPPGLLGAGPGSAPQQQPAQPPGMQAVTSQDPAMAQAQRMYGILAQIDPQAAAQGYGNLLSNDQRIRASDRRARDPVALFTRAFGAANPHTETGESLQQFGQQLYAGMQEGDQTGDYSKMFTAHGLLQPKEELRGKEIEILDRYITDAQKANTSRGRMDTLSQQFDQLAAQGTWSQGGVAGGIDEFIKKALGTEDSLSQVRAEYNQIRASGIMDNLPPGTASDADVALAASGWPAGVTDPTTLASFLRGMSKLAAVKEAQATHGAQFLSTNQSQKDLLNDWNKNRDTLIDQVMQPYMQRDAARNAQQNFAPPPAPFDMNNPAIQNWLNPSQSGQDNPLGLEFD